jgi:cyanophycin synthetase
VIVREDVNPRGRRRGEIAGHVMEGIASSPNSRVQSAEIIVEEGLAIDAALDKASAGDVVLLCVDKPAAAWHHLEARRAVPVSPTT